MSRELALLFLRKELRDLRTNRQVWAGYLILPAVVVGVPVLLLALIPAMLAEGTADAGIRMLFDTVAADPTLRAGTMEQRLAGFFLREGGVLYLLMPIILAASTAALSIVREKEQRTLEPILATPIGDRELLIAKLIAVLGPPLALTWATAFVGYGITAAASALLVDSAVGPTPGNLVALFVLSPALAAAAALAGIGVSARFSDSQAATQFPGLVVVPFAIVVVALLGRPAMKSPLAGLAGTALALGLAALLFRRAIARLRREELLTSWR